VLIISQNRGPRIIIFHEGDCYRQIGDCLGIVNCGDCFREALSKTNKPCKWVKF
jgi:hypothetical protein